MVIIVVATPIISFKMLPTISVAMAPIHVTKHNLSSIISTMKKSIVVAYLAVPLSMISSIMAGIYIATVSYHVQIALLPKGVRVTVAYGVMQIDLVPIV